MLLLATILQTGLLCQAKKIVIVNKYKSSLLSPIVRRSRGKFTGQCEFYIIHFHFHSPVTNVLFTCRTPEQTSWCLSSIHESMQDIRKLLSCQIKGGGVISRSPSTVQDEDEDEDDELFPLKNKEDMEEVELRLQNMKEVAFKAKLVCALSL